MRGDDRCDHGDDGPPTVSYKPQQKEGVADDRSGDNYVMLDNKCMCIQCTRYLHWYDPTCSGSIQNLNKILSYRID